jgi:hypothetical protein
VLGNRCHTDCPSTREEDNLRFPYRYVCVSWETLPGGQAGNGRGMTADLDIEQLVHQIRAMTMDEDDYRLCSLVRLRESIGMA